MDMASYHAFKALSASGVDALVNECPWKFWQSSPWNAAYLPENKRVFDIGTGAHLAVLEPEQYDNRVRRVPYKDYRTAKAQELRDTAYADGKVPIKDDEHEMIGRLATAIFEQAGSYFTGGIPEVSLTWDWDGVLCKARPDYLIRGRELIVDLKTTISANPHVIARKAFNEGWPARVCWYKEAYSRTAPGVVQRRPRYIFVVVETKAPHLIQLFELDERAEAWGQQIVRRGLTLFRRCMAKGEWPAYGEGVQKLGLPAWAEYGLADREAAGEFDGRYLDA
jgi:hypothetical protein